MKAKRRRTLEIFAFLMAGIVAGPAIGADGKHQAGLHGATVEFHRAGAAGAFLATDARALDAGLVAQKIHQQEARLDARRD